MKKLQLRKHTMTSISYMIPYVCAAGMLMVIGNIFGGTSITNFNGSFTFADVLTTLGGNCLGFLPIIISTGIAYSIADRPGIAPGFILGVLSKTNGYGFLGGLISGFMVGFVCAWLKKSLKVPSWLEGLKPQLMLPLFTSLIVGVVMQYIIGIPIISLTNYITNMLVNMQGGSIILFGIVIGILSAIDYGGPINKVVFVFASGVMSEGIGEPIAILIMVSMVAPMGLTIGYFLAKLLKRNVYSKSEVDTLKSAFLMGCCQITEGSYPIILNDLGRITLCTAIGAAVSGAVSMMFGCSSTVPAGGFFALPGINNPLGWCIALLAGSFVFAVLVVFLKRKPDETANLEDAIEEELDLSTLKIS
ncbi:PTS fructose transporter subunit IIC [Anaerorhabdus sp.]|uniref:PTS fructose transporter subunit IIC n=1 Tax=Anaerorhabdus sp. TaxID=1872524 RepID=UPI002FC67AE3